MNGTLNKLKSMEIGRDLMKIKDKETEAMRVILAWLDECPMAFEMSSMQGSLLHIKVSREMTREEQYKEKEK
jgi:hypothetical protein